MTTTQAGDGTRQTLIEADPDIPVVRIVREFDAPPALVYRAHADPELVRQWMGPRSIDMDIERWDVRTGGEYRYTALRDGEEVAHFYGSFHRVDEGRRIVQTFGFEEMPEAVSLETLELVDLGDGRTRLEILSVVESMEAQAGMMASGMEVGINEGYAALDEVLAGLAGRA
ncbi:SRPBCC family protein (plasmid) [Georgenia sp. TF02-10]|uniref:SRPBCC family protein n=1 Tax=Georgenia sp. TF02-10 TaxID=2917725 RepID=UPI001FA7F5B5|nr:SRPBCC family protein [Georgenia sp. TF02-10]UNX56558.1 SRPBCC family protein [Georgenia sp. TF02-10]